MSRRSLEDWFWQVSGDVLIVTQNANSANSGANRFWEPPTDLFEDESFFIARCELAGVSASDLQIIYLPDRHSLLIRGVRQEEDLPGTRKHGCHQLEIYFGPFERELSLPSTPVEPLEIRAQFRGGFLYILAPKSKENVRHARVTIRRA